MHLPPRLFVLVLTAASACSPSATPPPSTETAAAQGPTASASAPPAAVTAAPEAPEVHAAPSWDSAWTPIDALRGATVVFDASGDRCASTASGVRCTGSTSLGPLATTPIHSPTSVWGYTFVCGVGAGGAFVCNEPPSDRPAKGPPRLAKVTSVDLHAASHLDGTMSVTTNRDAIGYSSPRWAKVAAVTDAVQVASSFYATSSCYVRRSGAVACVAHAKDAKPVPVEGVTDAARIAKTDAALWVLTRTGRLLATRDPKKPLEEIATSIADFTPNAAAPGAHAPNGADVPCAVTKAGVLECDLEGGWKLAPVAGAGPTTRVFGGSDWICAEDAGGVVRCPQAPR